MDMDLIFVSLKIDDWLRIIWKKKHTKKREKKTRKDLKFFKSPTSLSLDANNWRLHEAELGKDYFAPLFPPFQNSVSTSGIHDQ